MSHDESLGPRKAAVLRAVVRDYIRTAEPVGSGTVTVRYRLGVSPATVRSEMAVLETLGYLAQPHTSAGRIPTDLGYRFYVDTLPRPIRVPSAQRRFIASTLPEPVVDLEEIVRTAAHILSRLTRYAAVALPPDVEESRVARAELVSLGEGVLLLVVNDTGRIDKRPLDLASTPDEAVVDRVSRRLAGDLAGLSLREAVALAGRLAARAQGSDRTLLDTVVATLRSLETRPLPEHVFVGGVANIADAFARRETLRRVVEALDEEETLVRLFRAVPMERSRVTVQIGRENPIAAMREASVVTAPYLAGSRPIGAIAVLGPTRMEYETAMAAVAAVAHRLSQVIEPLAG